MIIEYHKKSAKGYRINRECLLKDIMEKSLVPFRDPAKLTFNKLVADKLPAGSQTVVVVLDNQTLEGKSALLAWSKPHLKEEMVKDLTKGKLLWVYPEDPAVKRVLLVPATSKEESDKSSALRGAASKTISQLKSISAKEAVIAFGEFSAEEVGKFLNTLLIDNVEHHKKGPEHDKALEKFDIHLKEDLHAKLEEVNYWVELAKGVILAKNVVNQAPSLATPGWVEEQVLALFKSADKVKISSIVGDELAKQNYGCIYAVGKGAVSPPRLVTIYYNGNSSSSEVQLALVGKGVTFDSGGLNLKPTGSMEDMNLDKSGACNVLAALHCINELKLPVNVVGCLALAENIIGKDCYKPGDILTSANGKTIEVTNTDAEGRLCLIDGMTHVQRTFKPKVVIDIATLTGACLIALGMNVAGLFSNDDNLADTLLKCSSCVGEPIWRLPIFPEYTKSLKGSIADLRNTSTRYGGASIAAAFLKEFVEGDTKWAHLDVAGPAMKSFSGSVLALGTGFGTQVMVDLAKSLIPK